jgi:hypothetical protein
VALRTVHDNVICLLIYVSDFVGLRHSFQHKRCLERDDPREHLADELRPDRCIGLNELMQMVGNFSIAGTRQ